MFGRRHTRAVLLVLLAVGVVSQSAGCSTPGSNAIPAADVSQTATVAPRPVPTAEDGAKLFARVPVMKGARRVHRSRDRIEYVIAGGKPAYDRAADFYDDALKAQGWRFSSQEGAAHAYKQDVFHCMFALQGIDKGDIIVEVWWDSWNHETPTEQAPQPDAP